MYREYYKLKKNAFVDQKHLSHFISEHRLWTDMAAHLKQVSTVRKFVVGFLFNSHNLFVFVLCIGFQYA